jgi:hypothetical protein
MSITLAELVERLQDDVPARDGVPSEEAYERMVKEAVRDFSRQCGLKKRATLNIVAGTAVYDLAEDFLKLIKFISLTGHGGVINSPAGLIPVPADFCEEFIVNGQQITFYPTPSYSLAREYTYKAAWIATPDDYGEVYATMGEEEAGIVLMKASAAALDSLWRNTAGNNFKFQIGDESYDMTDAGNDFKRSRDTSTEAYKDACDAYNGNTSRML